MLLPTLIIVCGLLSSRALTLTNPIKMITQPANKIEVDLKLQIYIIKVQKESILGMSRMQGGDHVVTLCKSELVNLTNPYFAWHDKVFQEGRKMSKEQFMNQSWDFSSAFKHFKFVKDDYDGMKIVPLPRTYNFAPKETQQEIIGGVQAVFSYKEQIEFVVMDLSTEVGSYQSSISGSLGTKEMIFYQIYALH